MDCTHQPIPVHSGVYGTSPRHPESTFHELVTRQYSGTVRWARERPNRETHLDVKIMAALPKLSAIFTMQPKFHSARCRQTSTCVLRHAAALATSTRQGRGGASAFVRSPGIIGRRPGMRSVFAGKCLTQANAPVSAAGFAVATGYFNVNLQHVFGEIARRR